jgi:hypothetical protein
VVADQVGGGEAAAEQRRAGKQLVEHGRQRVDVGRRGQRPAGDLLRRQVLEIADEPAGGAPRVPGERGDPQVGQLRASVGGEQDVRRRELAVQEAHAVRVGEPGGDGERHRAGRGPRQVLPREAPAGDQFGAEQAQPASRDDRVGPRQVRMIELGQRGAEGRDRGGVHGVQHPDDDVPVPVGLTRREHEAEGAGTEFPAEDVAGQRGRDAGAVNHHSHCATSWLCPRPFTLTACVATIGGTTCRNSS